jgi:hypothetical protein
MFSFPQDAPKREGVSMHRKEDQQVHHVQHARKNIPRLSSKDSGLSVWNERHSNHPNLNRNSVAFRTHSHGTRKPAQEVWSAKAFLPEATPLPQDYADPVEKVIYQAKRETGRAVHGVQSNTLKRSA